MHTPEIAVVTGGTRGLGRALSIALARRGLRVIATGRDPAALAELDALARAEGLPLTPTRSDVSAPADNAALAEALAAEGAAVRLLIHNASVLGPRVPLAELPLSELDRVLAVNVRGPLDLTQRLLPLMGAGATMQVVTSGVGIVGKARWGAYSISKFALEGQAQIWADELGPRGVRVQIIDPGGMATRLRAEAFPAEDPSALRRPEDNVAPFLALAFEAGPDTHGQRFKAHSGARSG